MKGEQSACHAQNDFVRKGTSFPTFLSGTTGPPGQMTFEQTHIFEVRFPSHVQNIPQHGNNSHGHIDSDIENHPGQNVFGDIQLVSEIDEICGNRRGCDVSNTGNQSNETIQADPQICAGNHESVIHEIGDQANLLKKSGFIHGHPASRFPFVGVEDFRNLFKSGANHRASFLSGLTVYVLLICCVPQPAFGMLSETLIGRSFFVSQWQTTSHCGRSEIKFRRPAQIAGYS